MRTQAKRAGWTFLRRKRIAARLTQDGLAAATGYSTQYICNLETGLRGCSDEALFKIADAIGVEPEALFVSRPAVPPRNKPARSRDESAAAA